MKLLAISVALFAACASPPVARDPVTLPAGSFENVTRLEVAAQVPKLIERREPSGLGNLRGVEATVAVDVLVASDGVVQGSRLVSGDEPFYAAVAAAVQQWRFEPHIVGGAPAAFVVPVTFRLTWPAPQRANVSIDLGKR